MRIILFALLLFVTISSYSQSRDLKLWYNKPSGTTWENALPIGNGYLGAMVYGNVEQETIQLNESTVWSGSPNRNDNPLALDSLGLIRQLIYKKKRNFTNNFSSSNAIIKQKP